MTNYYQTNAFEYFHQTIDLDMTHLYNKIESYLKPGARILDLGSGSGRDSLYFHNSGYDVSGIDSSEMLCNLARQHTGLQFYVADFTQINFINEFDLIWCNASLVHLEPDAAMDLLIKLRRAIKSDGYIFFSLKESCNKTDRDFVFYDIETILNILDQTGLEISELWKNQTPETKWINTIATRSST